MARARVQMQMLVVSFWEVAVQVRGLAGLWNVCCGFAFRFKSDCALDEE